MTMTYPASVLKAVAAAISGPDAWVGPLCLDGAAVHPALPQGRLSLTELRPLLLLPEAPAGARDAVWSELVFHAQRHGPDWELGAVWMMSPGLRKAAWRVVNNSWVPYADIEAEVVEGFLRELRGVDVESPAIAGRLWWAGYRQGLRARDAYRTTAARSEISEPAWLGRRRGFGGHPDQVLERAVRAGAITGDEAELIGRTRLEDGGLAEAAFRLDLGFQACRARRAAAEERLARFLVVSEPRIDFTPGDPGAACGKAA
ncbi:hypothetical protein AB0O91_38890 [Kitasatospora sp. NPDC089797]|uniref:hypothetical protein n=1 Tax=Kitasatospora sp. NPDC089797 TaxID=3155298 RepID=UPI003437677E